MNWALKTPNFKQTTSLVFRLLIEILQFHSVYFWLCKSDNSGNGTTSIVSLSSLLKNNIEIQSLTFLIPSGCSLVLARIVKIEQ